jgi:hypothetical protein
MRDAPAPFRGPAFRALQREWYSRLADAGFVDAELGMQASYDGRLVRECERGMPAAEYYRTAGWWESDRVYPSRRHARVWALHTAGMTFRDIEVACRPACDVSASTVGRLVRAEVELMVRHYGVREEG